MKIVNADKADRDRWNCLIERGPEYSLTQMFEWGEFKESQGWIAYRLAVTDGDGYVAGAQLLIRPIMRGTFSVAYIPRGPIARPVSGPVLDILLGQIHRFARKHRAVFLKIEPPWEYEPAVGNLLSHYGFFSSPHTFKPRASIIVDLTPEPDAILANMHRSTRYNIRLACRRGIVVERGTSQDIPTFYELLGATAKRSHFPIRDIDYYERQYQYLSGQGKATLLLAKHEGRTIGARIACTCGDRATDLHGADSGDVRHLKVNHRLVWEAMKWAKEHGCLSFDLWGVPDEVGAYYVNGKAIPKDLEKGFWGVYQFKRGFGGKIVYYEGAYDYQYVPMYHRITNLLFSKLSANQVLERFAGD